MTSEHDVEALEQALLARARRLADEYRERGERSREHIIEDAGERLRLREQHEILAAKANADRIRERLVQAGELRLQADLDRLRWALVGGAIEQARVGWLEIMRDRDKGQAQLATLLRHAAMAINQDRLVARLNACDLGRFGPDWKDWVKALVPTTRIALDPEPLSCQGGVMVEDHSHSMRVDNTLEGLLERLSEGLEQRVMEQLFASLGDVGAVQLG